MIVLLVVIAILAAILFPVFAKAREKARQSSCLSNNKQIGLAIMQYAQDFDERLPQRLNYCPWDTSLTNNLYWVQDVVQPYVRNQQVFNCPTGSFTHTNRRPPEGPNPLVGSYTMPWSVGAFTPLADLKDPAGTILMVEATNIDFYGLCQTDILDPPPSG